MRGPGSRSQDPRLRAQSAGLLLAAMVVGSLLSAQQIQMGTVQPRGKDHVALLTDSVEVKPGQAQVVELRFRVDEGYHINSHTPKDELLIPTVLQLQTGKSNGVDVLHEDYPAGQPFQLKVGAGELLDVYQGEFRVRVRMIAEPGASVMTGVLRYQACDSSSCFPPRTLPVKVAVTGK